MRMMQPDSRHFLNSIGGNPHEPAKYYADCSGYIGPVTGRPAYPADHCAAQVEGYTISGAKTSKGTAAYADQGQKMAGAGALSLSGPG
ncbi:hypothetical protein D3C81_2150690 [compost metagenome]